MTSNPEQRFVASERRRQLRAHAIGVMGGKCRICGYNECFEAMDFHHLDPMEKDFDISGVMSWERVAKELRKCILVCATCHREIHAGMHPQYLAFGESFDYEPDFGQ